MREELARDLARQMASALVAVHEQKLAHRDIKPENFLFEREPADSSDPANVAAGTTARDPDWPQETCGAALVLTHFEGCIFGEDSDVITEVPVDLRFVSPEMLPPSGATEPIPKTARMYRAADMWAFGVILYALVAGKLPFDGKNDLAVT
jgi:serine/threonine protein kinase